MVILFKPRHIEPILSVPPRKWQTRRTWTRCRVKVGGEYWASTNLFLKERRFARLRITRLWQEHISDISPADAIAEGYPDRDAFFAAFVEINGGLPVEKVWCVEFEVVRPYADGFSLLPAGSGPLHPSKGPKQKGNIKDVLKRPREEGGA